MIKFTLFAQYGASIQRAGVNGEQDRRYNFFLKEKRPLWNMLSKSTYAFIGQAVLTITEP